MKPYKIIDFNLQESYEVGKDSEVGLVEKITVEETFNGKGLHNDLTITEICIKSKHGQILKPYGQGITIYYQDK